MSLRTPASSQNIAKSDKFTVQSLQQFLTAGKDLLFPTVCHLCDRQISTKAAFNFCSECLTDLLPSDANRCVICSAVVGPNLNTSNGCIYCKETKFTFQKVTTLGTYENRLKLAILRGKTGHDVTLLNSLTQLLYETKQERIDSVKTDLIIPIPHFWRDRLFQKSQASNSIASCLGQLLSVPVFNNLLKKKIKTDKQHTLTPPQRRRNLKNAFSVSQRFDINGASVLLVDDVVTTGTTCQRAGKLLLKAGVKQVHVFALARGIGA